MADIIARAMARTALSNRPSLIVDEPFKRTIKKLRAGQPVTIVCIGSSSTQGYPGYGAATPSQTYPAQLQTLLQSMYPNSTITVINKGIGGDTATGMLSRFQSDVFANNPDLVIWQTGTVEAMNNSDYNAYMLYLEAGVQALKDHHIDVALMDSQYYPGVGETASYQKYMWGMAETGERLGVIVIPRYNYMRQLVNTGQYAWSQLLYIDNFHPSALMYSLLAQYIANLLMPDIATSASRDYRVEFYDVMHPNVKITYPSGVSTMNPVNNLNNPEQGHYWSVYLTAADTTTNSITFSLSFFGRGARFIMPYSFQHVSSMTVQTQVDGGSWTTINASPSINPTLHQGAFTIADNLPYGFHNVAVKFVVPVGTPSNLYVTGFEVMAEDMIQISALERLIGKRVLWGLNVSAGTGLSISTALGAVFANGREVTIQPTNNLALAPADPTNPRIDAVVVTDLGQVTVITGTPASSPSPPSVPPYYWTLANVQVPANATTPGTITDTRRMGW